MTVMRYLTLARRRSPPGEPGFWSQPLVILLASIAGISLLANIGLIVLYILK